MTPVVKPIAKPPSVAVQSRSMPPTTTPTSTTIVSRNAKSGPDERELDGQHHRDDRSEHPGEQDGEPDHAVRPHAEQPGGAEVGGGGAHVEPDRRPQQQERKQPEDDRRDDDGDDRDLADVDAVRSLIGWLSGAIEVAISPIVSSRMSTSSAIAWSMNAIAKVATSITAGEALRRGRKTTRP